MRSQMCFESFFAPFLKKIYIYTFWICQQHVSEKYKNKKNLNYII